MSTAATETPKLRAELAAADVLVWIDPREQRPYGFAPMKSEQRTLDTADYCLACAPDLLRIERKELSDFVACCGVERERFMREMARLRAFTIPVVLIEATWNQLAAGGWRSQISAASVFGTAVGLLADGINVICGGDRLQSEDLCKRVLYTAARRRWREAREWVRALSGTEDAADE